MRFRLLSMTLALATAIALFAVAPGASGSSAPPIVSNGCIQSVPEPGSDQPVDICYTLYRPGTASAATPVPLVFHSHGWAGSRQSDPGAFKAWLDEGFGMLSFDQRGFGESGGLAHVENPDLEGQDVQRLIDLVARLDWVQKGRHNDPKIGAIGGSYGGGYQFVGAFTEMRDRGRTRFDAIAPQMTWWDLKESLAPQEVPRTTWLTALYAAGARDVPMEIHQGFAYAAATNNWPKGQDPAAPNLDEFFGRNGPAWHVSQGRLLDIPALMYQGHTDNLFNLNQGLSNFTRALTPGARARSLFVGYNGGHALPSIVPPGTQVAGDPCSNQLVERGVAPEQRLGYDEIARRFMAEQLQGRNADVVRGGRYFLATNDNECISARSVEPDRSFPLPAIQVNSGPGIPLQVEVGDGPLTVAGVPRLTADVSTLGPDARLFFGLSVGTSAADARLVQNNTMPLREAVQVTGARRTIELPGVAVEVPLGKKLFLTVSGFSDMSFGNGSRTPGLVTLHNPMLQLNTQL